MGVAVLSGVIASLGALRDPINPAPKWESHTPGTVTPALPSSDDSLPSRFLACVSRQESGKRLRGLFFGLGGLGPSVEVCVASNVQAVTQSDVVLLW
jgi:pyrroline-5-carboxylate reductase